MAKLLYLDYISLILYILMIFTLLSRTGRSNKKRDIFSLLLIVAVCANVYDISAVLLDNSGPGADILKYILHGGYLILRNLITPVFGAYAIEVTDTWHKLYKRYIIQYLIWIPFAVAVLLIISSPFTHLIYYIDDSSTYTRGPLFYVLYISAIFYTCFCLIYITKYKDILSAGRKYLPLFSIAPYQAIAVGIQYIYPNALCEMFFTSMSLLFIMLTVEKPDGKTDQTLGIYKSSALNDMIINATGVRKPMNIILINMTNYSAVSSYISPQNMDHIYKSIIDRILTTSTANSFTPSLYTLDGGMFAVILHTKDLSRSEHFADLLNKSLNDEYVVSGYTINAPINIAIVRFPSDVSDIDSFRLVAKEFRNSKYSTDYRMISSVINSKDYAIMSNMDRILTKAIDYDLFQVYYQPIYSVKDKRFNSAEALIRLETPEYGFISPALFISAAEDTGAIHKIGMIVFEKVCQFIASPEFRLLGLEYIEVNLSVVQCMDRDLAFKIFALIDKYNIDPTTINLEITETATALHQKSFRDNIDTLYEEGFSFSLDDFGTGYSNITRIASLPLNIVKLDRSFTWTQNDANLKIILDNSVNMLKKMNMHIVVEGIETEEMLNEFIDLGCDYIQGFYFSKPLSRDEFVKFIDDYNRSNRN